MEKILHKVNLIGGAVVALLSGIFGEYWYLFCAFLVLNVVDYVTGILKARFTKTENSMKGWKGIVKKVGYWVCIAIGFFIGICFIKMGKLLGIDLSFTQLFGWFTLATFIVNEIRSILENLVVIGVDVPEFLIKGLSVVDEMLHIEHEDKEGDLNENN